MASINYSAVCVSKVSIHGSSWGKQRCRSTQIYITHCPFIKKIQGMYMRCNISNAVTVPNIGWQLFKGVFGGARRTTPHKIIPHDYVVYFRRF